MEIFGNSLMKWERVSPDTMLDAKNRTNASIRETAFGAVARSIALIDTETGKFEYHIPSHLPSYFKGEIRADYHQREKKSQLVAKLRAKLAAKKG